MTWKTPAASVLKVNKNNKTMPRVRRRCKWTKVYNLDRNLCIDTDCGSVNDDNTRHGLAEWLETSIPFLFIRLFFMKLLNNVVDVCSFLLAFGWIEPVLNVLYRKNEVLYRFLLKEMRCKVNTKLMFPACAANCFFVTCCHEDYPIAFTTLFRSLLVCD